MSHWEQPGRRSWVRRHKFASAFIATGAVLVAAGVLRAVLPGGDGYRAPSPVSVHTDYRDPLQLGEAVREHYHGQYAGCGRNPDGTYACIVTANGAGASYKVTVSSDGKSWSAS